MAINPFVQPDYTGQVGAVYKGNIDTSIAALARLGVWFMPQAQSVPDLTVRVGAGVLPAAIGAVPVEVAAQNTAALVAPVADPRKDIVYVDAATGAVGVAAGAEDPAPVDPAVPAGTVPVCRINWTVGMAEIANADLDDLRHDLYGALVQRALALDPATMRTAMAAAADADLTAAEADIAANTAVIAALGTAAAEDVGTGAGNVVQLDGTGKLPAVSGENLTGLSSGLVSRQTFTASGTWTKPAGVTKIVVEVIGGGGGGGGGDTTDPGGSGGGGGYSRKFIDVSAISSETVTIAAGGNGGTLNNDNATAGGTSSFGAHCSATGGGRGRLPSGAAGAGGAGGAGSSGDDNLTGQSGRSFNFSSNPSPPSSPGGPFNESGEGVGGSGSIAGGGANGGGGKIIVWEYE